MILTANIEKLKIEIMVFENRKIENHENLKSKLWYLKIVKNEKSKIEFMRSTPKL